MALARRAESPEWSSLLSSCRCCEPGSKSTDGFDKLVSLTGVQPQEPSLGCVSHFFCEECISGHLKQCLDSGDFPAYCPLCKAAAPEGEEPRYGRFLMSENKVVAAQDAMRQQCVHSMRAKSGMAST